MIRQIQQKMIDFLTANLQLSIPIHHIDDNTSKRPRIYVSATRGEQVSNNGAFATYALGVGVEGVKNEKREKLHEIYGTIQTLLVRKTSAMLTAICGKDFQAKPTGYRFEPELIDEDETKWDRMMILTATIQTLDVAD